MNFHLPFSPTGNTVSVNATTSSAATALGAFAGNTAGTPWVVRARVRGTSANPVRFNFGTSSGVTATANNLSMEAGQTEVFVVPFGTTHVATICDAGTATIEFTPGTGA